MKQSYVLAISLLCIVMSVTGFADEQPLKMRGGQVEVSAKNLTLRFSSDGTPSSCMLSNETKELLTQQNKGDGFSIITVAHTEVPLNSISVSEDGKYFIARSETGTQAIFFRVQTGERHIAFYPERLIGFSRRPGLSLRFRMNAKEIGILSHNYMVRGERRGNTITAQWKDLNTVFKGDDPGGISIYHYTTPEDEDEALLDIWTEEEVPHPAVSEEWTKERATAWLDEWQKMRDHYAGRLYIEAMNLEDLHKASDMAQTAGLTELYLMPWIWRGEYWPIKKTNCGITTNIFPRGEKDFKEYSDFLAKRKQTMALHWVSGGIGFQDPVYVAQKPDRRLASWGSGTLLEPIDEKTGEIKFKPNSDCSPPHVFPGNVRYPLYYPTLGRWQGANAIRIDDEIIRFADVLDSDKDVWTFNHTRRGYGTTEASAHEAGAECVGLITAYGQNYVPDNNSSLLDEMAEIKASFLNRNNIPHIEFDGQEIHEYYGMDSEKFGELIYKTLDHPTSAGSSSGRPPWAWLEYRFNRIDPRKSEKGGFVTFRAEKVSRAATSPLMAHYGANISARVGLPHYQCGAGDRGFTTEDFESHGRANEIMNIMNEWRGIIRSMSKKNIQEIKKYDDKNKDACVVLPEKTKNGYALYPTQILPTGYQSAGWFKAGENGAIEPWRYIKTGDSHQWNNMFKEQEPHFIIQVLAAFNYDSTNNVDIQPKAADIKNTGDISFTDSKDGLVVSRRNGRNSDVWVTEGHPIYQKANKPYDLSNARGMGFFIEGDAEGEILTMDYGSGLHRNFLSHIDFKGRRYVEIPNGEVAYTYGDYGWWYHASKNCNYARIHSIGIGFRKVPAGKNVSVKISGLKALHEIAEPLINPTIKTDTGSLTIKGSIPSKHYIEYTGGKKVTIYDSNWNKTDELKVSKKNFRVAKGLTGISVQSSNSRLFPWLAVEFMTRGTPINVN